MAHDFNISDAVADELADTLAAHYDSGYLRIYDGSQPAGPDTAIIAQVLLAELRYNATAFGAASAGVVTAASITQDSSANATGTASWFRDYESDGTTPIADGTVGTSGCDLNLVTTSIVATQPVQVTSLTRTIPKT